MTFLQKGSLQNNSHGSNGFVTTRCPFYLLRFFSTPCEGEPLPHRPKSVAPLPRMCGPTFKYVEHAYAMWSLKAMLCEIVILDTLSRPKLGYILSYEIK